MNNFCKSCFFFVVFFGALGHAQSAEVIWQAAFDFEVGSVALGPGNLIYVGVDNGEVTCFTERGEKKWSFQGRGPVEHIISNPDGLVFASSGTLYALSPQGDELWHAVLGPFRSRPVLGKQSVYISGASTYYAFTMAGGQRWRKEGPSTHRVPPVLLGDDSTIISGFFTPKGTNVFRVGETGKTQWETIVGETPVKAPMQLKDENIWVTTESELLKLEVNSGEIKARFKAPAEIDHGPIFLDKQRMLIRLRGGNIWCVDQGGQTFWETKHITCIRSAPLLIDGKGTIWAMGDDVLEAVGPDGKSISHAVLGQYAAAPIILPNDRLCIGFLRGKVAMYDLSK